MYSLTVQFLLISAVSAVSFPGMCPNVPPSHFFPKLVTLTIPVQFLHVTPFTSATTSYIFLDVPRRAMDIVNPLAYYVKEREDEISGQFHYSLHSQYWYLGRGYIRITSEGKRHGDKVKLTSTVLGLNNSPHKCNPPLEEEVRVWFESDLLMIWSCVYRNGTNSRDEAALIYGFLPTATLHSTRFVELSTVKSMAKKYVSSDLLETITMNWKQPMTIDPFACAFSVLSNRMPIYFPILMFLGILCACWFLC